MSVEQKKSVGMIIWLIIWLTLSWMTTPAILKVIQQNNMVQVEKQFFTDVAPLNSHQFSRRVNHKKETVNLFEMWGRGRRCQFADQFMQEKSTAQMSQRLTLKQTCWQPQRDCHWLWPHQLWNAGWFRVLAVRAPLVRHLWGCRSSIENREEREEIHLLYCGSSVETIKLY